LSAKNELGDIHEYTLITEIMSRHSNIFLINKETGKIIDLIKRVSPENNSFRGLLPNDDYKLPPKQDKMNPFEASQKEFDGLESAGDIRQKFEGIGIDTSDELFARLDEAHNIILSYDSPTPNAAHMIK